MKYLTFVLVVFVLGCSTTPLEKRRDAIKQCTHELLEKEVMIKDAYKVCRDLYKRGRQ